MGGNPQEIINVTFDAESGVAEYALPFLLVRVHYFAYEFAQLLLRHCAANFHHPCMRQ